MDGEKTEFEATIQKEDGSDQTIKGSLDTEGWENVLAKEEISISACRGLIIALGNWYNFRVRNELAGVYLHLLKQEFTYADINKYFLEVMEDPQFHFSEFPSIKKIKEKMTPNYNAKEESRIIAANLVDLFQRHGYEAVEPSNWPFQVSFQEFIIEEYGVLTHDVIEKFGKWTDVCKEIESIRNSFECTLDKSKAEITNALYLKVSEKVFHFLKDKIPS